MWTHQGGKQANLPAPTYIDYVMTSIQNLIDDEKIFPTKSSKYIAFPIPQYADCSLVIQKKKIKPSIPHSQQRLGLCTANFYAFSLISIMHTINRYCTFDPNLISIHFLLTSLHLVENMSCWRRATSRENLLPLSA